MTKHSAGLIVGSAVGLAACLFGCAAHEELHPDAPELVSLDFAGNAHVDAKELKQGLATQPSSWVPFTRARRFDDGLFQSDLDRILTLYRSKGYFDVQIARTDVQEAGTKKVRVKVVIDEGQPYLVRTLAVHGGDDLPSDVRAALAKPGAVVVGHVFTQSDYLKLKGDLLKRLQEHSYAEARVDGQAQVDLNSTAVDVALELYPGPQYRFGATSVQGNQRVPAATIEKEVLGEVPTGAPYQESVLDDAQKRVFNLGVFSSVRVEPGTPDPDAGTLPVVTTVSEGDFHSVRAGVGLGLDVEHQEAHVTAGYTDRDFLGGLRRLDFDNIVALEWLPSVFAPVESAVPAFKSTLKLTQPGAFGTGTDLIPSVEVQRAAELGFGYWAFRGSVGMRWQVSSHVVATTSYNPELLVFDQNSAFNGLDLSPTALLSLSCRVCFLDYFEETIAWDGRDDPIEPTRGIYAKLSTQQALGPPLGDFANTRWLPEVRAYLPIGRSDVLALRIEMGALFTYDRTSSPIDQRFFLGGIDSVRGYGAQRLSPMVRVNTCGPLISGHSLCTPPSSGLGIVDVPVGGNGLIEANLEWRHKLSDIFNVVAFVDTGEVTTEPLSFDFSGNGLAVTPGLGLRVITPVGPIRLDLAFQATQPIRPVTVAEGTFGSQASMYFSQPNTSAGAMDTCPYPFVPQTGWGGYQHPSTCKSDFLNRFAFNIAVGEAF